MKNSGSESRGATRCSKLSLIPSQGTAASEALLIRLHEVSDSANLAKRTFELIKALMPYQLLILLFRPQEFDPPCRFFPTNYKPLIDEYMAEVHEQNIWLRRSRANPQDTVVRHSDYTATRVLHCSTFYKRLLLPSESEFGASIAAWRNRTWLATLTVMRNKEQGDFTDDQMRELQALQPHFACAARRIAKYQKTRTIESTERQWLALFPVGMIILDWNLKVLHYDSRANQLCSQWKSGVRASFSKVPRKLQLPPDILAEIERLRPGIMRQKWFTMRKKLHIKYSHSSDPRLKASIEFIPSRSLTLSKGSFLIKLLEDHSSSGGVRMCDRINQLTRRERECALLAARGLNNGDIASQLGKSKVTVRNQLRTVYRKLDIDTRDKLISAFAQLDYELQTKEWMDI